MTVDISDSKKDNENYYLYANWFMLVCEKQVHLPRAGMLESVSLLLNEVNTIR